MNATDSSPTIVTDKLAETRAFYERHFDAWACFDCGWYMNLKLGRQEGAPSLCLMEPRDGMATFAGGAMLNLEVSDPDALHEAIVAEGATVVMALEDHAWGDRGFGVLDPAGLLVYPYRVTEPSPEFEPFFKPAPGS